MPCRDKLLYNVLVTVVWMWMFLRSLFSTLEWRAGAIDALIDGNSLRTGLLGKRLVVAREALDPNNILLTGALTCKY